MVFIFSSSLILWFNLVLRHLRKIDFGTFNFVCSVWGMKLFRLGSNKCCVIVAFSTSHFVLEILHTTMLLLYREIFVYVAASLSDVCQLRRQAWFLYQPNCIITRLCQIQNWDPKGEKMFSLWFCSQFCLEVDISWWFSSLFLSWDTRMKLRGEFTQICIIFYNVTASQLT